MIVFHLDRILLIKRNVAPYKDCWALVGGAKDDKETYEECARRELREEVGLEVGDVHYLTDIEVCNELGPQLSKLFECTTERNQVHIDHSEVADAQWFRFSELPNEIVWFQKDKIEKIHSGKIRSLYFRKTRR